VKNWKKRCSILLMVTGGLVQKYELIKTDDLPRLPGSQFKPGIIKDVAQNILSFLKSKATKAGHSYWLFKGKIIFTLAIKEINVLHLLFVSSS
jgi:hypothetical protein